MSVKYMKELGIMQWNTKRRMWGPVWGDDADTQELRLEPMEKDIRIQAWWCTCNPSTQEREAEGSQITPI